MVTPCHKVAENLAKWYPVVMRKVRLLSDELVYLADKIAKQSAKDRAWIFFFILFFTAYSKVWGEKDIWEKNC